MTKENLPQSLSSLQGLRIHPALHFDPAFASLGIVDYKEAFWIVTSDRQVLPANKELEASFLTPSLSYPGIANRWDVPALNHWLANSSKASFGETVASIRQVIAYYCDLQWSEEATFIACWILGTYFHQVLPAFPRLHLHGERGTGKTKILQLVAALSFNGLLRLNPTPATLFRLIHSIRPTLCLDEIETLSGHDKTDLLSIVHGGYNRDGAVDRCVGDNHEVRSFQIYAPMALGGINGLNSITEDRCITIVTVKGRNLAKVNREVISTDAVFGQVRASCYCLTLSEFQSVEPTRQGLSLPDWFVGRHRELYSPLLAIAALADRDGASGMVDDLLALAHHELPRRSEQSFETEAVLTLLRAGVANNDPYEVRPHTLAMLLEDMLGYRVTAERAGHMLRRLGLERHRDQHGTYYLITADLLSELEGNS